MDYIPLKVNIADYDVVHATVYTENRAEISRQIKLKLPKGGNGSGLYQVLFEGFVQYVSNESILIQSDKCEIIEVSFSESHLNLSKNGQEEKEPKAILNAEKKVKAIEVLNIYINLICTINDVL